MTNTAIVRLTLISGCLALLGGAGLLAAAENMPTKASGNGSIRFAVHEPHGSVADDDEEAGRGFLLFEIERTAKGLSGSLTFGAETHHEGLYPEIVIRLNEIGAAIWRAMDGRRTTNDIIEHLCRSFDVERKRAEKDVLRFLRQLRRRELVDERDVSGQNGDNP